MKGVLNMRKEKLWRALFCGSLASAMILTGCSQSSGNSLEVSDTSVSGTVESIDGNIPLHLLLQTV